MSRTQITLGLLALGSTLLTAPAIASDTRDPHQRAREMIAPPISYAAAPRGAMGRLIDSGVFVDQHARAEQMLRAAWSTPTASGTASVGAASLRGDTHEQARRFIGGDHD